MTGAGIICVIVAYAFTPGPMEKAKARVKLLWPIVVQGTGPVSPTDRKA